MGFSEKIYDKSPIFIQNILVSLSGYLRNRNRYGKTYKQYRSFLNDFDSWSLEKKLDYQNKELISFVNYTYGNSPFYRKLFKDVDIQAFSGVKDLFKLPIMEKEILRENIDDIVTVKRSKGEEWHTGGTTGKSLVVIGEKHDMMKRMAMLDHFKSRLGFEHRIMRRATFNGKHIIPPKQKKKIYWRYNKSCKQMIYSSFHLSEENMKFYVESLNKYKPHAIDGFFTCIVDLASYIDRHDIKLNFKPIAVFPTSETLTDVGRELIEKVFKTKVYDQYASSEGAPFVTECINQNLHIELASGIFEKLSENSDEVLITSFSTHGTPLIRYRIGDSMMFENSCVKCGCGNEAPIIKNIQGRTLDYLLTTSGAKINGGNIANLFKNMPNSLIRAQTIQNKIDEIIVLLEVDRMRYKPEYDDILKNEFLHKFGQSTIIMIHHVESIAREPSGKFQFIKNNLVDIKKER